MRLLLLSFLIFIPLIYSINVDVPTTISASEPPSLAETTPLPEPEPVAENEPKSEPEPKTEPEPVAEPEPEPEPEPKAEPEAKSLPDMAMEEIKTDLDVVSNVDDELDQIDPEHSEGAKKMMMRMPINLQEISSEDYGTDEVETKPDNVDNDVIQQLVDRFLNKGTLEEDMTEKVNKAVEKLIGSSDYWKVVKSDVSLFLFKLGEGF